MDATIDEIDNLGGWLTTVTTRLCLDRLRARVPAPLADADSDAVSPDAIEDLALAETVGIALHIVLDRLTPAERVAFVLHDSFEFDFSTISEIVGRSPAAVRKLASRARSKLAQPTAQPDESEIPADWQVVDAFLDAARNGDFAKLLELLAPNVVVEGDAAAVTLGTPNRMEGAQEVAQFFNGAAKAAFAAFVDDRPGAAWILRGDPKVAFDFTVKRGVVLRIDFRADESVLSRIERREGERRI